MAIANRSPLAKRDHDIALLVRLFDIPMGLDDLLQGMSPVDDGLDLARLDELPYGEQILDAFAGW
jgi:hypothetical protein